MMNLLCRPGGVLLVCSGCEREWPVQEGLPFVAQLRMVALGHTCPAGDAEVLAPRRSGHLRLVPGE